MLQPDPLALGAVTTSQGELIDAGGGVVTGTYVVGSWRAADLWESTAVPELRGQAAAIAASVAMSLASLTTPTWKSSSRLAAACRVV